MKGEIISEDDIYFDAFFDTTEDEDRSSMSSLWLTKQNHLWRSWTSTLVPTFFYLEGKNLFNKGDPIVMNPAVHPRSNQFTNFDRIVTLDRFAQHLITR